MVIINIANTPNTRINFSNIVMRTLLIVHHAVSSSIRSVPPGVNHLRFITKSGLVISSLAAQLLAGIKKNAPSQILSKNSPIIFLIPMPHNEVIKKIITIISQKTKKYYPRTKSFLFYTNNI
jgi:hypothetical protein